MKFQGVSVVRNMLVITLLLFGGLYAVSYLPMMLSTSSQEAGYEADYSYRFLNDADEPDKSEINDMAAKHNVTVENYREGAFLRVFGGGTERDSDDGSQLTETYYDRYTQYDVTSASEFEKMTGTSLDIPSGSYYQIIGSSSYENIWYQFGDMDQLYVESEDVYLPFDYIDTVSYESLNIGMNSNMGDGSRFVVSDADFDRLKTGLEDSSMETQVLFDIEGSMADKIAFSNELFLTFAEGMSEGMDVLDYYNAATAEREGSEYTEDFTGAVVDPENPLKATDWQFSPLMVPILDLQLLMELSTRLLMFSYIFIICIAAVGVIGYTRSQSVGLTNLQIFEDIRRLGANRHYRMVLMRRQLNSAEIKSLLIIAAIAAVTGIYQYAVYRLSAGKTRKLLKI